MVSLFKQLEVLVIALGLFNIGLLLFICFICFIFFVFGALVFYVPFRRLKQKISKFVVSSSQSSIASEVDKVDRDEISQLNQYIAQLKDQTKDQSKKILFLKERVHKIAAATNEAIVIFDEHGKLLFYNPQSQEIFHLELSTEDQYLREIARSPDVVGLFKKCLKTKATVTRECYFRKKNEYVDSCFQVTAVYIHSEDFNFKNIALLFYDQTKVKESQQAHVDFVSNVSHELKTPLTSIHGYLEMLIHDFSQKKFNQFESFLQVLLRNCKRMSALVDDLLSLSDLTSQNSIEKKRLSTKEITNNVMEQVKKIDHKVHFFFSAPYVMAHPVWVEIVMSNLVENAFRHTAKECDVYIRWEKMRDRVVLKVIDSGEGIPDKYKQRIFERFFKMDPARSREKGGTGVGLSLVKQSMEKHGGCVRAVSADSGGMEFICEFPNA